MPEISEKVSEALEAAEGDEDEGKGERDEKAAPKSGPKLNTIVAALVAVAATFMALCNVKAGNVVQAMGRVQVEIVDTWSFFQAKSTKQNLSEAAIEQMTFQREGATNPEQRAQIDKQIAAYREKVARYEKEKNELKSKVDGLQKEYDRLNVKDDQFDMSEALLSVAIALFGITALTQKRWLMFIAIAFGGFGLVLGVAGFAGLSLRPQWLANLLGA
jgi:uncharacterized protein HemX